MSNGKKLLDSGQIMPSINFIPVAKSTDEFSPLLGFGYNSQNGRSYSASTMWIDFDSVLQNTRGSEIGATRHSKFVKSLIN